MDEGTAETLLVRVGWHAFDLSFNIMFENG